MILIFASLDFAYRARLSVSQVGFIFFVICILLLIIIIIKKIIINLFYQGCEQLILVGDHHQLPPTVKSRRATEQGLGVSLFTRLALAGVKPCVLTVQYRMHPHIAHFPSKRYAFLARLFGGHVLIEINKLYKICTIKTICYPPTGSTMGC